MVLVEVRDNHVPVSYADAFARPVDPRNEEAQKDNGQIERVDLPKESAKRLIAEANRITTAFSRAAKQRLLFTGGLCVGTELAALENAPVTVVVNVDALVADLRTAMQCPEQKSDEKEPLGRGNG